MEVPPNAYLHSLGALLSTKSPAQRLNHTETLLSILSSTNIQQAPLIASLTTQAVSQLFTNDHINTPTEVWSRHPSYTEPLLESLLNLLSRSFLQPPPQSPPPSQPAIADLSLSTITISPSKYNSIYPAPHPDLTPLITAFQDASKNLTLATAHLLHLFTTLSTEKATNIARLSYHTLASLTRLLPSETNAAFLPGLTSSLSKSLSHAAEVHSTVCIAALDAFHVILSILHLPPSKRDKSREQTPPVTDQASGKPRLSVIRDAQWIETASKQAALRIVHLFASSSGPLHHTSPRTREHLATFIAVQLRGRVLSDQKCRAMLRIALFSLAGDAFPSVRAVALQHITQLLNRDDMTLHHIQSGVRAVVSARGFTSLRWDSGERVQELGVDEESALKRLSGTSDYVWTHIASGYLNALVPSSGPNGVTVVPTEKLASSVTIIGPDAFCRMLTELLSEQWAVAEDSPEGFTTALDCLALRAAASLGRGGLLTSIFSTLVERIQTDEFDADDEAHLQQYRERCYATLVLQSILRGEIRREDAKDSEVHQRLVYECTKETLQLMNGFFLPSADMLGSEKVDDGMISLKHCLLVCTARLFEDLAALHRGAKIRSLGADITLVVLMSLLRDVSNGEVSVRKTARETMTRISLAIGWKNERKLLFRHLNYIIGRVIRNLEEKWAGDVLGFVIGKEGDDVSREATVLLESTFQRMNESLAGAGDERALSSMNSIVNILSTAVAQKEVEEEGCDVKSQTVSGKGAEEVLYQNDLSDLRRSLFEYCKEDMPNYEKLTSKVELINKSFVEGDGSDDESKRGAFETIAIHALEGTREMLAGRPWNVCAASLRCATLSVKLLEGRRRILLPFAAKILPLVPDQFMVLKEELTSGERMLRDFRRRKFGDVDRGDNVEDLVRFLNSKGRELPVVTNGCLLLGAFAAYAGSFIRDRFVRLIYPKLGPLLRLAQCFPTLLVEGDAVKWKCKVSTPSYGAMSASDACLEAIASVAMVAPDVLAPLTSSLVGYVSVFFDGRFDPARSGKRHVVHTNRAAVRFECERWTKRCEFAETIIRQLKIVNGSVVLMSLLKCDNSAPREISGGDETLRTFVRKR